MTGPVDEVVLVNLDLALAAGDDVDSALTALAAVTEQAPNADALIETIQLPQGSLAVTPETGSGETGRVEGDQFSLLYLARGPPGDADGTFVEAGSVIVAPHDQLLIVAMNPEDSGTSLEVLAADINLAMVALVLGKRSRDEKSKKESSDGSAKTAAVDPRSGWRARLVNGGGLVPVTPVKHSESRYALTDAVADTRAPTGLDPIVIDVADAERKADVEAVGMRAVVTPTIMGDVERAKELALVTLEAGRSR